MNSSRRVNQDLRVPCTPGEFTPECLTAILRRAGTIKKSKVESVKVDPVAAGTGFVGQLVHLELTYDKLEPNAPVRMFAKLSSADADVRAKFAKIGLYETEVGFYRELSREVGIRVPTAYATHYDPQTGQSLLLLEEMKHMRFGDNLAGSTLNDARLVISTLARMQAAFWNSERLKQCSWLRGGLAETVEVVKLYRAMLPVYEKRWDDTLTPELILAVRTFDDCIDTWFKHVTSGQFTLMHGDLRPDNFAFDDTGATVLFDWQIARRAANCRDLAYFMTFALPADVRRMHEMELLEIYLHALHANGVHNYTMQQLRTDYRCCLGAPLITSVIAGAMLDFSSERGAQLHKAICDRMSTAVIDHDYAAWLPPYLKSAHGEA